MTFVVEGVSNITKGETLGQWRLSKMLDILTA
jgi:hypothetical protein